MEHRRATPRGSTGRARAAVLVASIAVFAGVLAPPVAAHRATGAQDAPKEEPPTEAEIARAEKIVEETLELAPDDVPPSPDDVFVAVVEAQKAVDEAGMARIGAVQRAADADKAAFVAAVALDKARKKEAAAVKVRDTARTELSTERERLSDLTVRAYVTGGEVGIEEYRALIHGDTTDPARGRAIMFEQVLQRQEEVTALARKDLNAARKALVAARQVVAKARDESTLRATAAATRAREKADAEGAHLEALVALRDAQARLRAGRVLDLVPEGVALIGLPRLNADDLAGWFATSPYKPRVLTPITDYAKWFIEEGNAEGMRGDIAFAQAVLETGGFANQDSVTANNFSGIGHCDLCPSGWTFPSPQMGVRAQIQLLKSYAIRKPTYVNDLVDKRLRGPAGCCQTWGDLTTVWATDPGYGPKVMLIYTSMVSYALQRRALGQG